MNLSMKPLRFFDFWKYEPDEDYPVTLIGVSGKYKLDQISAAVWTLLNGEHTIKEIIATLANKYTGVDYKQIKEDVINLLAGFNKDMLIILDYNPLCPNRKYLFQANGG